MTGHIGSEQVAILLRNGWPLSIGITGQNASEYTILLKNPGYDSDYIAKWLIDFEDSVGQSFLAAYRSVLQDIK